MTTGKTIALARSIFVGKVMSLLFNMLSRLVLTFLPRNEKVLNPTIIALCFLFVSHQTFHPNYEHHK